MEYKVCNIKGFEGLYHIYEDGSVYSVRKNKMIKCSLNTRSYEKYAYLYTTIAGHAKDYSLRLPVHRLVYHHFVKDILNNPTKLEVNHIDMNKMNNHYTNLELVSHIINMQKARKLKAWDSGRTKGYITSEETKRKQAIKKYKKILCYNDTESLQFNSIQDFINYFNTYRKAFNRYVNSYRTFKGFYIRYI